MQENTIKTVLFIGRPGSGKATQANLLSEKTGYTVFSTGKKFRELREQPGPLGSHVRKAYDTAKLLPAWFASYLFEDALFRLNEKDGIIFEGTGRAREEAELFHEIVEWLGRPYVAIHLDIGEEEARRRQAERALVQNRTDSNTAEKIRTRFDEYNKHTVGALAFFRGKGVVIDIRAEGTIESIHEAVLSKLGIS